MEIECPGDTISYNCSIQSNSETLHLTWQVLLPEQSPINITHYKNASIPSDLHNLSGIINSTLTDFSSGQYIESALVLTIVADITINQTQLSCIIDNIGNDTVHVFVNKSGKKQLVRCLIFYVLFFYSTTSTNRFHIHNGITRQ